MGSSETNGEEWELVVDLFVTWVFIYFLFIFYSFFCISKKTVFGGWYLVGMLLLRLMMSLPSQ